MAENVHKRLESMVDLDILVQSNIYTRHELRMIINKRREFEYKVNGTFKRLNDFKEYIQYEMNLQKLISLKREVLSKNVYQELNHKLLIKIKSLFEITLMRFPCDDESYFVYFAFCKRTYFKESNKVCDKMLKHHPNNEKMWRLAAEWYARDRKEYSFALKLLQQGIRLHKKSTILYMECLQYEVLNYKANESEINCEKLIKRLEIYCNDMFEKIDDIEHYGNLIKWAEGYDFLKPIEEMIVAFIKEKFKKNYKMWDILIKKTSRGINLNSDLGEIIDNSIKTFETALNEVDSAQDLWNSSLGHYDDIITNEEFDEDLVVNKILDLYKKADDAGFLSEENYIRWAYHAPENECRSILELAVTRHESSLNPWVLLLESLIIENAPDIEETFDKAIKLVSNNEKLYLMMERYYAKSCNDEDEIISFYQDALTGSKTNTQVKNFLKPKYVEWLSRNKDIDTCREAFKKLMKEQPAYKPLYKAMCAIEGKQKLKNFEEFEAVHKVGCEKFGRDSIDVWLDYTKFLLCYHKDFSYKEKIYELCKKARAALPDFLFNQFNDEFQKIFNKFEILLTNL